MILVFFFNELKAIEVITYIHKEYYPHLLFLLVLIKCMILSILPTQGTEVKNVKLLLLYSTFAIMSRQIVLVS
jgi:hypothetical protein